MCDVRRRLISVETRAGGKRRVIYRAAGVADAKAYARFSIEGSVVQWCIVTDHGTKGVGIISAEGTLGSLVAEISKAFHPYTGTRLVCVAN